MYLSKNILVCSVSLVECDCCPTDPSGLHFEPPRHYFERPRTSTAPFEPRKLLIFYCNADPDPAFYSYADPDPAPKNIADLDPKPCLAEVRKKLDINGFDIVDENDRNKICNYELEVEIEIVQKLS